MNKEERAIWRVGLIVAAGTMVGLLAIQQTVSREARNVTKTIAALPVALRDVLSKKYGV
jgi:hypothetical protein